MSRALKIKDPEGLYFVTFTVVNWIDLFIRKTYKDILIDSLKHCQENKGLVVHAFVIMTSHVHLIVSRKPDGGLLSDTIRDFKKYTSGKLLKAIKETPESRREWLLRAFGEAGRNNPNNSRYQVWIQDNHPVELITKKFVKQKLDYVHNNPVETGIVFLPYDYVYSSACAYAGRPQECLLPVELIELPLWE